jgi:general stress protein CsbA
VVSMFANLRWGVLLVTGFSTFQYGAWLGLVFGLVLIALAALRLGELWRTAP